MGIQGSDAQNAWPSLEVPVLLALKTCKKNTAPFEGAVFSTT